MSVAAANMETFARHGLLSADDVSAALARITPTQSVAEAGADASLVIESIAENLEAKRASSSKSWTGCPRTTRSSPATRRTSTSSRSSPSGGCRRRVVAHWFAPPQIIPLVEVVKGPKTASATVELVVELLKKVDRVPVVMEKFVPGFCVNRFLRIIGREVFFLLDNGYMTAEQLDLAVKASIIPRAMVLGFVQRYDFTGLDLSLNNLQNSDFLEPPIDNSPSSLAEHVEKGEMGVKSGKGFFDYSDRDLRDVLRTRDDALIEVFNQTRDLIYQRV